MNLAEAARNQLANYKNGHRMLGEHIEKLRRELAKKERRLEKLSQLIPEWQKIVEETSQKEQP